MKTLEEWEKFFQNYQNDKRLPKIVEWNYLRDLRAIKTNISGMDKFTSRRPIYLRRIRQKLCVQKNTCSEEYAESMVFKKYKLRHRCFDNNLEKNARTNINLSKLQNDFIFTCCQISLGLNFKKCIESTCRGTLWT